MFAAWPGMVMAALRSSSKDSNSPVASTTTRSGPTRALPAGAMAFWAARVSTSSLGVVPSSASLESENSMNTRSGWMPCSWTLATSSMARKSSRTSSATSFISR